MNRAVASRVVAQLGRRRLGIEADWAVPVGTLSSTSAAPAEQGVTPGPDDEVRVLLIDGRQDRRQLMSFVLEQAGDLTVVGYADGPLSAVEAVDRLRANAVVVELQLSVTQGLDTISALRDDFPALAIIVCSFHVDAATRQSALDRGADAYLVKPLSLGDLRAALQSAPSRSTSRHP